MLWFVSQSRCDSSTGMMDGVRGARAEEKEPGRGGGKMCSDESEERHEREAK